MLPCVGVRLRTYGHVAGFDMTAFFILLPHWNVTQRAQDVKSLPVTSHTIQTLYLKVVVLSGINVEIHNYDTTKPSRFCKALCATQTMTIDLSPNERTF